MNIWKYIRTNISIDNIVKYEQEAGIVLTDEIKEFILTHNYARPEKNTFDTKDSKERVFLKLLSFNHDDKENVFDVYSSLKKELPVGIVPIAMDPFGNFICLDANNSTVVFWKHEDSKIEFISDTFPHLINSLY